MSPTFPARAFLKTPTPDCERAALRLQAADRAYRGSRTPSLAQAGSYAEALLTTGRYDQCLEVCGAVASPDAAVALIRAEAEWRVGKISEAAATVAPHASDNERCKELLQFTRHLQARRPHRTTELCATQHV